MLKKTHTHRVVKMKLSKLLLAASCVAMLSACDNSKPENIFSAQYSTTQTSFEVMPGSIFIVPLTVKNTSTTTWDSKAATGPVLAAYHWLGSDRKMLLVDGNRTSFSAPVKPESEVSIQLGAAAPTAPGNYILQVSLVQENISWFDSKDVKPLEINVKVK